uniref:protein DGCR6-like n=1 Tax=Callithrix jacchus TaxID=9483 RepID=UPI0023DD4DD9|nr:protein DGCR6-like [Callithrix jacchus]
MDRYAGFLEEVADDTRQQERHYQLLSALQSLVKELPNSFQQLLSYTRLSDLALALLDGTVFKIVPGVLEIQHLIEKSLYNQRLRLQSEHRVLREALRQKHQEVQQACWPHDLPVLQVAHQQELERRVCSPKAAPDWGICGSPLELHFRVWLAEERPGSGVEHQIREEQWAMDWKIILELDRKVADQQSTLEKAGVAGFYVTTNPQVKLMLQMNLLELIRKLQQRGCQAGKASLGLGGCWQPPAAQCDQEGSPVPP